MGHGLRVDVAATLRALRSRLGLLAVAAWAVGIGANTAVFSVVDEVLLDPLPWPGGARVVAIWETNEEVGPGRWPAAPAKVAAWRGRTDLFDDVGAWRDVTVDGLGPDGPERLRAGLVDASILPLLGVEPVLGRTFTPAEATPGGERVALLPHGRWVRRHGADPGVVGSTLSLDGEPWTVVGVLPPGQTWPADVDVVLPLVIDVPGSRASHAYRVLARLAPGVDADRARRELDAMAARLAAEHPDTDRGWGAVVSPLRAEFARGLERALLLFQGAVLLVLLVASANVAGLLLVRSADRRREMAVRASLGASRGRLVRQLVLESTALAVAGGLAGLGVARVAAGALLAVAPPELPVGEVSFDVSVYAATLALALACGLVFGLAPALRGLSGDPARTLRGGTSTDPRGSARLRGAIVTGEVALAALLLVGGVLFARSLSALDRVEPGFEPRGLLTARIEPPRSRYQTGAERAVLYERLVDAVGGRAGVVGAAAVSHLPLAGRDDTFRFRIEGRPAPSFADLLHAQIRAVSPGFLEVSGTPVVEGRGLLPSDGPETEPVAVVNRQMARRFWPAEGAVGQRIGTSGPEGPWIRVVGVVADVRQGGLAEEAPAAFYVPLAQEPWPAVGLVVRASGDPLGALPAVREAVREVDPLLPLGAVRTGGDLVSRDRAPWRFQALLAGVFAALAVALALMGVFGLLSHVVRVRTRELGIRRALGARGGDLRRLVGGSALRLTLPGVAAGLGAGALLSRVVSGMLFGVEALDPVAYGAAAVLLPLAALTAAWWPARRAAGVDPAEALRGE